MLHPLEPPSVHCSVTAPGDAGCAVVSRFPLLSNFRLPRSLSMFARCPLSVESRLTVFWAGSMPTVPVTFVVDVEGAGELRSRGDAELAVGALQVRLDRLDADEHLLGDRLVAQAVGGEPCDAELGRAQLLRRTPDCDPVELVVDAGEPGLGA